MKRVILLIFLILLFCPCFGAVTLFVAHSDDEIIGATSVLSHNDNITIIVFTDGAPSEYGLGENESLIRAGEEERALNLLNKTVSVVNYGFDDLSFYDDLGVFGIFNMIMNVSDYISNNCPTNLYVHAYEAGHVDHDTVNFIVANAYRLSNCSSPLYEFVEYNYQGFGMPLPHYYFNRVNLTLEEVLLKREMLSKFVSQDVKGNCTIADYDSLSVKCRDSILYTYYFQDEYFKPISDYNYFLSPCINYSCKLEYPNFYETLLLTKFLVDVYVIRFVLITIILLCIVLYKFRK
ncbi:GlcNAc-PI de-N-acetylase [Candidatus Tiddalikarchaeum anstoanum]|nr:GlcNAc-PI de-N-acetylase [Candidatus Tiddalikarchaeum anstoanum]